jgi:hypothetical protein
MGFAEGPREFGEVLRIPPVVLVEEGEQPTPRSARAEVAGRPLGWVSSWALFLPPRIRRATSSPSSVEPSSTMMISSGGRVCSRTLVSDFSMKLAPLYKGITAAIVASRTLATVKCRASGATGGAST